MRAFLLLAITITITIDAHAHRPVPARSFSNGLEPGTSLGGITVLQTPASPRVLVPGGTFPMGAADYEIALGAVLCRREPFGVRCSTRPNDMPPFLRLELPMHAVTISTFHIDRTEVTVDAYRRCVGAGKCPVPGFPALDPRFDNPTFPVTHVSWDDAVEYCKFVGGRLPTEAEWEYAARGEGGRAFPWGNVYNPHLCNHGSFAIDATDASDGYAGLAPVGSFKNGATPLGVLDMAGNVTEWVQDKLDEDPVTNTFRLYSAAKATNPVGTNGPYRMLRGGSYIDGAHEMRATTRDPLQPNLRLSHVGFRCAYPDSAK